MFFYNLNMLPSELFDESIVLRVSADHFLELDIVYCVDYLLLKGTEQRGLKGKLPEMACFHSVCTLGLFCTLKHCRNIPLNENNKNKSE